jgi:hypothetical protein
MEECYAAVGPLLRSSGGKLTPEVRGAYLAWAEKTVLQELGGSDPIAAQSLDAVRSNDTVRTAVFGSVYPPDPSILQNWAQLRARLGDEFLEKYGSIVIAVAVARRVRRVETADEIQSIGSMYQHDYWPEFSVHRDSRGTKTQLVHLIAEFMRDRQVSAQDLYQNASLQEQLRAFLSLHGDPAGRNGAIRKDRTFAEHLMDAMILLDQRPAQREPTPDVVEWIKHLAHANATPAASTPTKDGKPMPWPLLPLDKAPWPLLCPLSHAIPISEADYIFETFQGMHGPDRHPDYVSYKDDDARLVAALVPSKWHWDAWPDRIVHGGSCMQLSLNAVDFYSGLGIPAMWAGQPWHGNLITFGCRDGAYITKNEQSVNDRLDVTAAQWFFNEDDKRVVLHCRELCHWPWSEYHFGLTLAMNNGLASYMDTRLAEFLFRVMPDDAKRTLGVAMLRNTIQTCPYNPDLWYRLGQQADALDDALALMEAARTANPALLVAGSGAAAPQRTGQDAPSAPYWSPMAEALAQFAILDHPAPKGEQQMRLAYTAVQSVNGQSGEAPEYAARLPINASDDPSAVEYDRSLAQRGDSFGELRMGQRCRDGAGVPQSDGDATEWFARAAIQGDRAAAKMLADLAPAYYQPDLITVTASSEFSNDEMVKRLVNGAGMTGAVHDNEGAAATSWHTPANPNPRSPAPGLPASPAWVRFDFAVPIKFDAVQIWNHNQKELTDRGFRLTRLYGSSDGATWAPITSPPAVVLPRATGLPASTAVSATNRDSERPLKSVIIAADRDDGNYGSSYYGLSAVRFVVRRLRHVVPAAAIKVSASSVFGDDQVPQHLIDGAGMVGRLHDNNGFAATMWHSEERKAAGPPAPGLPAAAAWVRFDFAKPQRFEKMLIWNHNQSGHTNRGFRRTRIWGSADGVNWVPLTSTETIELPPSSGEQLSTPAEVPNAQAGRPLASVIVAADVTDGNYGGNVYGLSAVRFVQPN